MAVEGSQQAVAVAATTSGVDGGSTPLSHTGSVVGQGDLSSAAIEAVAAEIRELDARTQLQLASEVGRIILARFYGGDAANWHSRAAKALSLRRLARLLEDTKGFGASSLCRCVQIHLVVRRLGAPQAWTHLSVTHFRVTLALPDAEQETLLRQAQAERWTVRHIRTAVAAWAEAQSLAPKIGPRQRRALRRLERVAREPAHCVADLGDLAALHPRLRDRARDAVIRAIEDLEDVAHRLAVAPSPPQTHRLTARGDRRNSNLGAARLGVASRQHPPF